MADFTAELLDRLAVRGASTVAIAYLDEATAAAARLGDRKDAEALHDFRVAIRRLRVTLRAYPALHESVSRKQNRRLRKLARATNPARDAEVQIAWFTDRAPRFTPSERAALAPLRARLRARRRRALARMQPNQPERFGKLERKLRRRLATLQSSAGSHEVPFHAMAATTLVQHASDLRTRLREAFKAFGPAELHAARIAAKRLRYLLEPVEGGLSNGRSVVQRLKQLQDLLGNLTDAHDLQPVLQEAGAGAAPAITLLHNEVAALCTKLRGEWSTSRPELEREIEAAVRQLRGRVVGGFAAGRALRATARTRRRRVPA